jgi:hypothetical protein
MVLKKLLSGLMNKSILIINKNRMKKELVISLYDRSVDWVKNINEDVKISIYRKGDKTSHPNEIYLENNVGRDVHTFFYHIVKNYDNLADYTFVAQDYPFDHVNNYIELINGDMNIWDRDALLKNNEVWFFDSLFKEILTCDRFGSPHHPGLDLHPFWDLIFTEKSPENFQFVAGGHFCISKKQIHLKNLNFYKKILLILENEYIAPWVIERFEPYIFS